jgi:aspartokinase/homoserine dehydrogenase 1
MKDSSSAKRIHETTNYYQESHSGAPTTSQLYQKSKNAPVQAEIFVAGMGTVGGELLRQLHPALPPGKRLRLIGFCNSKLALFNADGIEDAKLPEKLNGQQAVRPTRWTQVIEQLSKHSSGISRPLIFVDATGSREVALQYARILDAGMHIVTPSKIANTMPQNYFNELVKPRENGALFRYEAAAGAGLPVVQTIRTMVENGDEVRRVTGVLSGTMTYIFGQLEQGVPFSKAVMQAKEAGYTEPDPRDDLSGEDVARKCMILARTAGYEVERDSFEAEDQTPEELAGVSVEKFIDGLSTYDESWRKRVEDARADGKVLRYVGNVEKGRIEVGVKAVPAQSPLGSLRGADNQVAIYSRYYQDSPVIIQGLGAGSSVTAQGILADIREILG